MQNTIGDRIVNLRKQKGLTQVGLAEILKISDKAVSKWESNKGDPSLEMIVLLSNFFNCTTDYLIKGEIQYNDVYKNFSVNSNRQLTYEEDVFYRAMDIVKNEVSAMSYELWLSSMRPVRIEEETFIVIVQTKIIKDFVKKVFKEDILNALQQLDSGIKYLHILVEELITDKPLKEAVRMAILNKGINTSRLQSRLMIGYPTAYDIISSMEYMGYISKNNGHNLRDVCITEKEFEKIFNEPCRFMAEDFV